VKSRVRGFVVSPEKVISKKRAGWGIGRKIVQLLGKPGMLVSKMRKEGVRRDSRQGVRWVGRGSEIRGPRILRSHGEKGAGNNRSAVA